MHLRGAGVGEAHVDAGVDHLQELTRVDRERIFNLGYYTWVEQQGVTFEEFTARESQDFWVETRSIVTEWDEMIDEFNARTGVLAKLDAAS